MSRALFGGDKTLARNIRCTEKLNINEKTATASDERKVKRY